MTKKFVRVLLTVSVVLVLSAFATSALAASDNEFMTLNGFPNKPIEFVTHSGVGGGGDILSRAVIAAGQRFISEPIVVVNKPGAASSNMEAYMTEGKTDGHTINVATNGNLVWYLMGSNNMDILKFLTPIACMQVDVSCFIVPASSKYHTMQEFIEDYKLGKANIAGTSVGNSSWVFTTWLSKNLGVPMNYIPFQDGGEMQTALIGAHVDASYTSIAETIESARGGLVRILAVTSEERLDGEFTEIPTLKECGIDYVDLGWRGYFCRAGTSPEHVKFWEEFMRKAYEEPSYQKWLADNYSTPIFMGAEEFTEMIKGDEARTVTMLKENAPDLLREGY